MSPVLLLSLLIGWYLWSAVRRYQKPVAVLAAMFRLQFSNAQIVRVGEGSDVVLAKVHRHQAAIDSYMKITGWSQIDWMGAEGQTRKGNRKMRVVNFPMTRYFRIIGFDRSPYVVRGS